jgi:hypothetical protein
MAQRFSAANKAGIGRFRFSVELQAKSQTAKKSKSF